MNREPERQITITEPWCPACGVSGRGMLHRKRTHAGGDGSKIRPTICRVCGWEFMVVVENPPVSGGRIEPPA